MTKSLHFEPLEEGVSQEQAFLEKDIPVKEFYGQTVWDGNKLVTPEEWAEQKKVQED